MTRHRYRVTRRLPWIDGGRPGPHFTWIGGTSTIYEPGDTIVVDDREVPAIFHSLAPTNDNGRLVLEAARAAAAAPARRTMLHDFDARDRAWLIRATDDQLRREAQIQKLAVRMLERGEELTLEDLAAAIQEIPDTQIPKALLDYAAKVLRGQPRRSGPKKPTRTTWQDLAIVAHYQHELERARHALEINSRRSRAVTDVAKRATATAFGMSKRTVERILALAPLGVTLTTV